MSATKQDRNEELIKDYLAKNEDGTWKNGIVDLVAKYRINSTRIWYILKRAGVMPRN